MKNRLVFLYSDYAVNALTAEDFSAICEDFDTVSIDRMTAQDLAGARVALYAAGAHYRDETYAALVDFYRGGGTIIAVGAQPFSIPYTVKEGQFHRLTRTVGAVRALGPVESYVDTGSTDESFSARIELPQYAFLQAAVDAGVFQSMEQTASCCVNLARVKKSEDPEAECEQDTRMDVPVAVYDRNGRRQAAPMVCISHRTEGCLFLLNFTPKDAAFYRTQVGHGLLGGVLARACKPRLEVRFEPKAARYKEDEAPEILVYAQDLNQDGAALTAKISLRCYEDDAWSVTRSFLLKYEESAYTFENVPCGQFAAEISIFCEGELLHTQKTGFYKLSHAQMMQRLAQVPRITVDTGVSPDFCLQEGKPFAMHGTTYFVTDVFRRCYLHFNTEVCDDDLAQLQRDGFNILRSGNWQLNLEFYAPDGSCSETAMRALEAFFITAAKYGFTVQYVLGSFIFNNWNREQDPLHNPDMRSRVMRVIDAFTKRFAEYPNVMLDIINEPSYSYRGGWTLGRPSLDAYEKLHWAQWLKKRYHADLCALHDAWRTTAFDVPSFDAAPLPKEDAFDRYLARTETDKNFNTVTDFYQFARDSYSDWVREIREIARKNAPDMVAMMGRDESIRIPSEQDEIARGNIDLVNWHQWGTNSIVFMEYYLNKVRDVPCCGQEVGVYQMEDACGFKRLDDNRRAAVLEKKLLYSFGNWIQWQAHSDPFLYFLSETTLGLYRADRTETASLRMTRALCALEERIAPRLTGRREDEIQILTLHPTYYYFSMCNPMAIQGVRSHVLTLHYACSMQSDLVLEHLFTEENRSMWGSPKVIFVPCAQVMADNTWAQLKKQMQEGATVVLSGTVERDEFFREKARLSDVIPNMHAEPIYGNERLRIGERCFDLDFRRATGYADAGHGIDKAVMGQEEENLVRVVPYGRGRLVHCPLPVELAESADAVAALYEFALTQAGNVAAPFICGESQPQIMIYPMVYERCTVYTLVNEGAAAAVCFTDRRSGQTIRTELPAQRGCKICIGTDGELVGAFAHRTLHIGGRTYEVKEENTVLA